MLELKAPAKINWFLKVRGIRDDGYHEIESLIQKVDLYDNLVFRPSNDLTLISDLQIPDEQNLVYRSAVLIKERYGVEQGVEIWLKKSIPTSAGLGGGSSDAASTLLGLNELWSLNLSREDLCALAEQLGSDVPFFLHEAMSLVKGRGEKVFPLRSMKSVCLLLVKPDISISAEWAYKNIVVSNIDKVDRDLELIRSYFGIDSSRFESTPRLTNNVNKVDNIELFIHAIDGDTPYRHNSDLNSLESVALKRFPVIGDIKKRLIEQGAIFSLMSGSGPTVFGVFRSTDEAEKSSKIFGDCWTKVVQTITD